MKRYDDASIAHTAQAYLNNIVGIRKVAPVCAACGGTDPDGNEFKVAPCGSACGTGDE